MQSIYALELASDVRVHEDGSDVVVASATGRALRMKQASRALRSLIELLGRGGMSRMDLCNRAVDRAGDDGADPVRLHYVLDQFERKGFVRYTVTDRGRTLATLEPIAPAFRFKDVAATGEFRLSRFAVLRRVDDAVVVECPLGFARIVLRDDRAAAIVASLAVPQTASDLAGRHDLEKTTCDALLALLVNAAVAFPCVEGGRIAEDESVALRQWEFHDLLFHSRSRLGRHNAAYGATFRFLDSIAPLPAVKPPRAGRRIALEWKNVASSRTVESADVPFWQVVESRRSVRTRGERPLRARQLGEFLYRTARVKALHPADPAGGAPYESSLRPCASGGAMHELELYLTISRVDGVAPGLYHYDPLEHALEFVAEPGPSQEALLADACMSAGLSSPPDVLITIAARFQRTSWKYQSLAYAAILKNVGALIQQMYLVATAMHLAPCALGGGDSDRFAEAAGLDYYAETSVGEFVLSSC